MSTPDPKTILLKAVAERVVPLGFRKIAKSTSFSRSWALGTQDLSVMYSAFPNEKRVNCSFGVRFESVEAFLDQVAGEPSESRRPWPTVQITLGSVLQASLGQPYISFSSIDEIPRAADQIMELLQSVAIPFYEQYADLHAVDKSINPRPDERSLLVGVGWLQYARGAIVAKLVNRPEYHEIIEFYASRVQEIQKGFFAPNFARLIEMLNKAEAC